MATSGRSSVSRSPTQKNVTTDKSLKPALDWSNDLEFLSPNDIPTKSLGLLNCLITKCLFKTSFTSIHRLNAKNNSLIKFLVKKREALKSNSSSVTKCFMINRLITECERNSTQFDRQRIEVYKEIQERMSSAVTSQWSLENFYDEVTRIKNLQCQRRLFYVDDDTGKSCSLPALQYIASNLYSQLHASYRQYSSEENRKELGKFLQHCFIIVLQPSIPECVAATKYEKSHGSYFGKLSARILCLVDRIVIENHWTLPAVDVKLYPSDRQLDADGEVQKQLEWEERKIVDAEGRTKSFLYVELKSIELNKKDTKSRPLYSGTLCQLEFNVKIQINDLNLEENIKLISQSFGVCSHAQYYPQWVTKVILDEVTDSPRSNGRLVEPQFLTYHIVRYHIRISGVEIKQHTSDFIANILTRTYDQRRTNPNATSLAVYENVVVKLISQMELYIDHPFLSMMYQDGLFLGICDSVLDRQLCGKPEQPMILLRFNTYGTQLPNQHPFVRFITHTGILRKATFSPKSFVEEMFQVICEANSPRAKEIRLFSQPPSRSFHDFSLYFDKDLFRLDPEFSSTKERYSPIIPVLWKILEIDIEERQQYSPASNPGSVPHDLSHTNPSLTRQISVEDSDTGVSPKKRKISHDPSIIDQPEDKVRQLVDNFFDRLTQSLIPVHTTTTTISIPSATVTGNDIEQHKECLYRMLMAAFPHLTSIDDVTQAKNQS